MQIGDGDDVRMPQALHERKVAADRLQLRLVVLHLGREALYGDINTGAIKNRLTSCPTVVPRNVDAWAVGTML